MGGLFKVGTAVMIMAALGFFIMEETGEKVDFETTLIMAVLLAGWIAHKED